MIFLRKIGENGGLYKISQTLAADPFFLGEIHFDEKDFKVKIINNDPRVKDTITKIKIGEETFGPFYEQFISLSKKFALDSEVKFSVEAGDNNRGQSLILPLTKSFGDDPIIIKKETFSDEFYTENGLAVTFDGLGTKIRSSKKIISGFAENFSELNPLLTDIEITDINTIGRNAFKNSLVNLVLNNTGNSSGISFYASAFENHQGDFKIIGEDLIVKEIGNRAFAGTKIKNFNFKSKITSNIGSYVFSNCTELESVHIEGSADKYFNPRLTEGLFENCEKLKSLTGSGGFNFTGLLEKNVFKNCKSLEIIEDNKDTGYGSYSGLIELGIVRENALLNCANISKKNIFLVYENSEIHKTALSGVENMLVLYPSNKLTDDQVKLNYNLPDSAMVCRFPDAGDLKKTDTMFYFCHDNQQSRYMDSLNKGARIRQQVYKKPNFTYHYILKYLKNEQVFSFKEWLNRAPYHISAYSFSNTPIKYLFIPEGCHKIQAKAFFGCENLTIHVGDYEKQKYWDDDWNLKGFDENGNKVYHNVVWASKGW